MWRVCLFAIVLAACGPAAAPGPTPAAVASSAAVTATPAPTPSASPSPSSGPAVEYRPQLLLTLRYGPDTADIGATTARVGGLSPVGITTFAVDDEQRIYIFDRARLRIVVYENGAPVRAIAIPYVEPDARSLLVEGGRLYLRSLNEWSRDSIEYEIDAANGALLRAAPANGSTYPRLRANDGRVGLPIYGDAVDAFGNRYAFEGGAAVQKYLRYDAAGAIAAYAVEPLSQKGLDLYVRRDGALFELASDWGGVGAAYVYALMPPIGTPAAGAAPSAITEPLAFGRPVPDEIVAVTREGASVVLDAPARRAVWWLASTGIEVINSGVTPGATFDARWADGSRLTLSAEYTRLTDGSRIYATRTSVWDSLAAYFAGAPQRLSTIAASATVTVRLADIAEARRTLTAGQVAALRRSLASAFSVIEGALPGELEHPFPLYEIVIGDAVLQLRGDRYAAVGRYGAFTHDGSLYDLVRGALPVPALALTDPRSLFLANAVTIEEDGYPDRTQDISRWKASLVRELVGTKAMTNNYPEVTGITLTFAFANGRTEKVRVTANAYTYRGTTYSRPGIMDILGYRGVP